MTKELNRASAEKFDMPLWDDGEEGYNLTLNYHVDNENFGCGCFKPASIEQAEELFEFLRFTLLMKEVDKT